MTYSKVIITDDNADEEIEKLSEIIGISFNDCAGFFRELPSGFTKCESWGYYEKNKTKADVSGGGSGVIECGQIGYEFGNGFIVYNCNSSL